MDTNLCCASPSSVSVFPIIKYPPAINELKKAGAQDKNMIVVAVISAVEGVQDLEQKYPGITIVTAALDKILNTKKYIVPGLGDFGDRFFGNACEQNFEAINN